MGSKNSIFYQENPKNVSVSVITTPDHPTESSSAELQRVGGDAESRNDEDLESNGEVLCLLKFGTNGVLEVSPDFSHGRKPYRQAFYPLS